MEYSSFWGSIKERLYNANFLLLSPRLGHTKETCFVEHYRYWENILIKIIRNSKWFKHLCYFLCNMPMQIQCRVICLVHYTACRFFSVWASKGISLCSCRRWINQFYVANSTNAPIYQSAIYMNDIRHDKYMQQCVAVLFIWMHYTEVSSCLF